MLNTATAATTAPVTATVTPTPDHVIRGRNPDWMEDEFVIVRFNDGSWCTNYGRLYLVPITNALYPPPLSRTTVLDRNTIAYIQTICRIGETDYGCDAIRKRVACAIINTYYNGLRREELERIIAGEVEAEKVMSDAYSRLTSYSASQDPGVNGAVWVAVAQLKASIESIRNVIKALEGDLAKLN